MATKVPKSPLKERETVYFDYIIIGGGFAGLTAALALRRQSQLNGKNFKVCLISESNFQLYTPEFYKLIEGTGFPRQVSYTNFPFGLFFRQGVARVISFSPDQKKRFKIKVQNNGNYSTFHCHNLLFSTGCLSTPKEGIYNIHSLPHINKLLKKLEDRSIQKVFILGAGPLGIESAASIRHRFPWIDIEIHETTGQILRGAPSETVKYVKKWLYNSKVPLHLYSDFNQPEDQENTLTLSTTGLRNDKQLIDEVLGPVATKISFHNDRNLIPTDEYCQVEGAQGLFAIGDVAQNISGNGIRLSSNSQISVLLAISWAYNVLQLPEGGFTSESTQEELIEKQRADILTLKPYLARRLSGAIRLGPGDGIAWYPVGHHRNVFFKGKSSHFYTKLRKFLYVIHIFKFKFTLLNFMELFSISHWIKVIFKISGKKTS